MATTSNFTFTSYPFTFTSYPFTFSSCAVIYFHVTPLPYFHVIGPIPATFAKYIYRATHQRSIYCNLIRSLETGKQHKFLHRFRCANTIQRVVYMHCIALILLTTY